MANLYLDRRDLEFEETAGALAIRDQGILRTSLPLTLIDNVVIAANLKCSTQSLLRIAESGVGIIVLDTRQPSKSLIIEKIGGRNALRRIAQLHAASDAAWSLRWSQRLIESKLFLSLKLLSHAALERPTLQFDLNRRKQQIIEILQKVRSTQHSAQVLMGLEGAAAAAYFTALTTLFPPSLSFHSRNRRPPLDPVNACLSLGYTLVQAEATRQCAAFGLDPSVGFFHSAKPGRDSLACDLTETERAHVDAAVWELFRQRILRLEHFRICQTSCLLGKAGRQIFYQELETMLESARRRLNRRVSHLARSLDTKSAPSTAAPNPYAETYLS